MYGVYSKAMNVSDSGSIGAATAVYGEIEIAGTSDIYGTSKDFNAQ
jgi:hypothetical protein